MALFARELQSSVQKVSKFSRKNMRVDVDIQQFPPSTRKRSTQGGGRTARATSTVAKAGMWASHPVAPLSLRALSAFAACERVYLDSIRAWYFGLVSKGTARAFASSP